ncbi:NUDIX hydrolase [Streptomyces sp. E11-3]|uniref:NUDIX hydrolase n=1 Tax=Streptomyces sp. E11-3 TaxID=3110112 RepID=UPI00397F87B7
MGIPDENYLAAAVVMRRGRVLLVRRSRTERFLPGVWGVPCGKLKPGESPQVGVLRELKEETGLRGSVVSRVGSSSFVSEYEGREIKNYQDNFLVCPLSTRISLPLPDQAYDWIDPHDLGGVEIDAYNQEIVRQAVEAAPHAAPH